MNAGKAIERLGSLLQELRADIEVMNAAQRNIEGQWERLKKLGGGRDDHAATLLQELDRALRHVEKDAQDAKDRLQMVIANPFGD